MRTSHNLKADFENCQKCLGQQVKVLVQEREIRWNSTFLMLKQATELRDALTLFYASPGDQSNSLSPQEWELVGGALEILQSLYEATHEISGERSVTGSKVIPLLMIR